MLSGIHFIEANNTHNDIDIVLSTPKQLVEDDGHGTPLMRCLSKLRI